MEQNTSYSLILTKDQADYLSASKQGINRMQALVSLINLTRTTEGTYEKKGFAATVHVGQFVASEVELSHQWKCDRKTVSRVLDQMNQVGLVSTVQNNRDEHPYPALRGKLVYRWPVRQERLLQETV